jgi:hypothetical protein
MALRDKPVLATTIGTDVFQSGNIKWKQFNVDTSPKPLLVFTPTVKGTYPVILFCHGFAICNSYYSKLLGHITSHGYIVVAPQLVYAFTFTHLIYLYVFHVLMTLCTFKAIINYYGFNTNILDVSPLEEFYSNTFV